ncbi:MAG: hypothetical protein F9K30_23765 [Dechloromonas sp.]|nr:MAG: hypothetical protein F9K30_23765 [Dechloromonas sp.]
MKTLNATAVNKRSDQDNRGLRSLKAKTVFLAGDAASVGKLGKFLIVCAEEMRRGLPFHRHFRDYLRDWDPSFVDVVVDRADSNPKKKADPVGTDNSGAAPRRV